MLSLFLLLSCETDTDIKQIEYSVTGLISEYKVSYYANGENNVEVIKGGDFTYSFEAKRGDILYFDIQYKDEVDKMSNFAALITVDKVILDEAYAYDMKWADSASASIPYPFEIILNGNVPFQ